MNFSDKGCYLETLALIDDEVDVKGLESPHVIPLRIRSPYYLSPIEKTKVEL
jgi:hypothetical protein